MVELFSSGAIKMTCKKLDQTKIMEILLIPSMQLILSIGLNGLLPVATIKNVEIEMEMINNIAQTSYGLQPRTKDHGVTVLHAMDGMKTCV